MGWALALVVDIGALVVVARALVAIRTGLLSHTQLALLVGVLAFAGLCTGLGIFLVRKSAPGGDFVRVGPSGIEIEFRSGRKDCVSFEDPNLKMELYDFSNHPELSYEGLPYSVVVHRAETEIPEAAFGAIYERVRASGLIYRSARPRSPFVPRSVQPMVHYVRGRGLR